MLIEDQSKPDQKMVLWLTLELSFNINLTQKVSWPCTWDMVKITNHHALDSPSILSMIRLRNSKQACSSRTWQLLVWICKLSCLWCSTKNAIQESNLYNWVLPIFQTDLKELFKTQMLPSKKLSLSQINKRMLLLICKHKFPKLRLLLQLLLTMPRLKSMLPSQQIWPRWELIYWLQHQRPMHIMPWRHNSDSLMMFQFSNILRLKQSMDSIKRT